MSRSYVLLALSILTMASNFVTPAPAIAQLTLKSIVCHVSIPGSKLIYRLSGTLPPQSSGGPQNPIGTSLQLTVQEDAGNIKTLLKRATLQDYGTIAPDADYSKLPFTGVFQAKPNNPKRLYNVSASAHGLYVSLRPIQGEPNQIQVVHYLSSGKFIRGQGTCSTSLAAKLAPIQTELNAKNWAAADRETRRMFYPQSVNIRSEEVSKLSPEMIRAIDQAWLEASDGRFGLRVQLQRWKTFKAGKSNDREAKVNAFRDLVGWKIPQPRKETDFISSDWRNESELTYSLKAPIGHLPWVGISDSEVLDVAIPDDGGSCGSCTIDAMALRSTHFYGYIPKYFEQIEAALKTQ
jgi:hypothetical protein